MCGVVGNFGWLIATQSHTTDSRRWKTIVFFHLAISLALLQSWQARKSRNLPKRTPPVMVRCWFHPGRGKKHSHLMMDLLLHVCLWIILSLWLHFLHQSFNSTDLSVIMYGFQNDPIEQHPFDHIFNQKNIWSWWFKVRFIPMNCIKWNKFINN